MGSQLKAYQVLAGTLDASSIIIHVHTHPLNTFTGSVVEPVHSCARSITLGKLLILTNNYCDL